MAVDGISSGLPHLQAALKRQLRYTKQELGPLIDNRGRRFRYGLFSEFRDIAPEKGEIRRELEGRGWRIKRRKSRKTGKRLTVEKEIRARESSRKFLAASFITPEWRASKAGQRLTARARKRRSTSGEIGLAVVNTAVGVKRPSVRIESFLEGAVAQNKEKRIISKVEREQIRDIGIYLRRKIDQRNRRIYREISKKLIPVVP